MKVDGLWPLNAGGRIRSFQILSELSRRHRVILATTHGPHDDPNGLLQSLPQCEQVISIPYVAPKQGSARFGQMLMRSWFSHLPVDLWKWRVAGLREEVSRLMLSGEVDLCVADFLRAVPNVPLGAAVPVVLFAHNVEHIIWRRLAQIETSAWRRGLLELEWRKMRRWEARACTQANGTIAVSEVDRALLAATAPGAKVARIPTGVDTRYFTSNGSREIPTALVFTGAMDWYLNEDGILHFIDVILPRIRRDVPDVSLTVVGRNPSARLRLAADRARIRVTGTVDDIRPYVAEAAVYVVPLRLGGGTRLKIFEALAMGKAVVATTVGAEGLPLVPGKHFLQADDPAGFARAVVSLLRNPDQRKALGVAGQRLVEERYSWAQVACEFEERLKEVRASYAR